MKLFSFKPANFTIAMLAVLLSGFLVSCQYSSPGTTTSPGNTTAPPANTTTQTNSQIGTSFDLVAENIAFNLKIITVPAGAAITINFVNKDPATPHNFAIYNDSSATPPAIFQGQTIVGPANTTYNFVAPSTPGTYFFRCDTHPTVMTGSLIVK